MLLKPRSPTYFSEDFEEKILEISNPDFKSVDLAPFNIILKYGSNSQKKEAIRMIFQLLKTEQIDFLEGINLLYSVIETNSDQDVVLYASESINNVENILLEKISETKNKKIEYAKYSFYYALSPFLTENQKIDILLSIKQILLDNLATYPFNIKTILLLIDVLQYLGEDELIEEIIDEKVEKLNSQTLLEKALLFYIKKKKKEKVKKLLEKFNAYNFTFKNEALKVILE